MSVISGKRENKRGQREFVIGEFEKKESPNDVPVFGGFDRAAQLGGGVSSKQNRIPAP
jgi:hypothetical protein